MNYLITWFYAENKDNESFYPSVGGNTSSPEFHKVYWKCVYDFYQTALLAWGGTRSKLLFFTNVPNVPTDLDGVNLDEFFRKKDIEVVHLELTNKTPSDWYGAWRNQFYVFDVLSYLADVSENEDNNYLILDSDCLIMSSLDPVFDAIDEKKVITYNCGYREDHNINGITTLGMRDLYKEFYHEDASDLCYKGGEIIGINESVVDSLLSEYKNLWVLNYEKYLHKETKLNEEAHFLSLLYYRLGYKESYADRYIKRMWTAVQCDNIAAEDSSLIIWHLPAEKKYGFRKIFDYLKNHEPAKDEFLTYVKKLLVIPGSATKRKSKKILMKLPEKLQRGGSR